MELDRWVTVVTPESTALQLALAGPGSRLAALVVDAACQVALLALLAVAASGPAVLALGADATLRWLVRWWWPILLVLGWLVVWAWPVAFEVLWRGQTPGKRALGLRVVSTSGQAVGWAAAMVRNLVRVVDLLPVVTPYLAGGTMMVLSSRGQRLGDLAAGTLVVRELPTPYLDRLLAGGGCEPASSRALTVRQLERLTADEVEVVGRFLRRSDALPLDRREALASRLARSLADRLGPGAVAPAGGAAAEAWLVSLQAQWQERRTSR